MTNKTIVFLGWRSKMFLLMLSGKLWLLTVPTKQRPPARRIAVHLSLHKAANLAVAGKMRVEYSSPIALYHTIIIFLHLKSLSDPVPGD